MEDALTPKGDEGRGKTAKCFGELFVSFDPEVSEWGNPIRVMSYYSDYVGMHTWGSETSQYPEEKKANYKGFAVITDSCGESEFFCDTLSSGERKGYSPNPNTVTQVMDYGGCRNSAISFSIISFRLLRAED